MKKTIYLTDEVAQKLDVLIKFENERFKKAGLRTELSDSAIIANCIYDSFDKLSIDTKNI